MQEKLAITIILISLALFALIFVLYRIVNENSERYNKIVLSQRQHGAIPGIGTIICAVILLQIMKPGADIR